MSGSQGLPSCAEMGNATQGDTGLGELTASSLSPLSVAMQRCCIPRHCPGPSPTEEVLQPPGAWTEANRNDTLEGSTLKGKKEGGRSKKRSPFG